MFRHRAFQWTWIPIVWVWALLMVLMITGRFS